MWWCMVCDTLKKKRVYRHDAYMCFQHVRVVPSYTATCCPYTRELWSGHTVGKRGEGERGVVVSLVFSSVEQVFVKHS